MPLDSVSERYSFENDLLIRLNIIQVSAKDVPSPAEYGDEVSSISLSRVIPELVVLLTRGFWHRMWYRYVLWSFSPIALLLFSGLFLLALGLGISIWVATLVIGAPAASAATVMLAVLPLMVGVQFLVSALQLDIAASPSTPGHGPFNH